MSQAHFPCRVGDVVIAGTFRISPEALADHVRSLSHQHVVATPGAIPGALLGSQPRGAQVPAELLVASAAARLQGAGIFHGYRVRMAHAQQTRVLSQPVLGEPVNTIATVRYRSVRNDVTHVTFQVELRRRSGEVAMRFELALDIRQGEFVEPDDALVAA